MNRTDNRQAVPPYALPAHLVRGEGTTKYLRDSFSEIHPAAAEGANRGLDSVR